MSLFTYSNAPIGQVVTGTAGVPPAMSAQREKIFAPSLRCGRVEHPDR